MSDLLETFACLLRIWSKTIYNLSYFRLTWWSWIRLIHIVPSFHYQCESTLKKKKTNQLDNTPNNHIQKCHLIKKTRHKNLHQIHSESSSDCRTIIFFICKQEIRCMHNINSNINNLILSDRCDTQLREKDRSNEIEWKLKKAYMHIRVLSIMPNPPAKPVRCIPHLYHFNTRQTHHRLIDFKIQKFPNMDSIWVGVVEIVGMKMMLAS